MTDADDPRSGDRDDPLRGYENTSHVPGERPTTAGPLNDLGQESRKLRCDNFYDPRTGILYTHWDSGFFSNCTTALWALTELAADGITPARICMDRGWNLYCDRDKLGPLDLYGVFFSAHPDVATSGRVAIPPIHHHGRYAWLGIEQWTPFIRRWFLPSGPVLDLQRSLAAKYHFTGRGTIGFYYRGTDKATELTASPVDRYMETARALASRHRRHRIFIQTDQAQMRDRFMEEFGDRCFFVEEMPVTQGTIGFHLLPDEELGLDRIHFGMLGMAVTRLLSECDVLVNCTGNMALWAALYRGNVKKMYQFDEHGDFVDLKWSDHTRNFLRRLARRLKLGRARRFLGMLRRGPLRDR